MITKEENNQALSLLKESTQRFNTPLVKTHVNRHYAPFLSSKVRYRILMGGRGAGRSTVASQDALIKLRSPEYYRCAIMRFVLGDIRNSIYQDIYDRIEELGVEDEIDIREHGLSFKHKKNRINGIGFRKSSSDQKSKLKSLANYNEVIIEEADETNEEDFMQLDDSMRTVKSDVIITLLLNPPDKNHWIIKRWFNLIPSGIKGYYIPVLKDEYKHNTLFIHTTYENNKKNLSKTSINNYENYKNIRPDHYYNMIKGLVSEGVRGRIYQNWKPTTNDVFNQLPFPSIYGLDFGFTNDPASLTEIKTHNTKAWVKELIYETGLTNRDLSTRFEELGLSKDDVIYADSAEPKSIQELRDDGWNVIASVKGADSIMAGIDMLLNYEFFYTEDSKNIEIEQQEYKWALDKNKEPINKPIDDFNHAMDGIRYAIFTDSKQGFVGFV